MHDLTGKIALVTGGAGRSASNSRGAKASKDRVGSGVRPIGPRPQEP